MKYGVIVKGRNKSWHLEFENDAQAEAMRADGFEVDVIINTIPVWVVDLGLARAWCLAQDIASWPANAIRRITRRR